MATTPSVHHHGIATWAGRRLRHDLSNWRLFLVRLITSSLAVVLTVALLPGLRFEHWGWGEFLLIGLVFGLLNALLKPLIQFFALRYLIASYGLVVVLINALLLGLLSWILGDEIEGRGVLAFLAGGLLVGVIGLLLDTVAGATPPILERTSTQEGASGEADLPTVADVLITEAVPLTVGTEPEDVDSDVLAQAAAVLSGGVDESFGLDGPSATSSPTAEASEEGTV